MDTLQSVSLMNIDSSSRRGVAYLHPLHLCVNSLPDYVTLKGSGKVVKTLENLSCHSLMNFTCRSKLWSPYSAPSKAKLSSGWLEVEICKGRC